jgi:hypothetical protein
MTHPILSRIPFLGKHVDERFLEHRRRSMSLAAIAATLVAGAIFYYRLIFQHLISWDIAAVIATMAVVKISLMAWYRFRD